MQYHVSAKPLLQSDRKKAQPYGAIVTALSTTNALFQLAKNISDLPLAEIDALALTVERTDEKGTFDG